MAERTTMARYCWCASPCFIFFRMALDASPGLNDGLIRDVIAKIKQR